MRALFARQVKLSAQEIDPAGARQRAVAPGERQVARRVGQGTAGGQTSGGAVLAGVRASLVPNGRAESPARPTAPRRAGARLIPRRLTSRAPRRCRMTAPTVAARWCATGWASSFRRRSSPLVPLSVKRRYEVALGHCTGRERKVHGRHPDQTSAALGAAGVMLGPVALALAAWLHTGPSLA